MLVLSRKRNEKLYIGGEISITVVGISKGRVKLGIDAPSFCQVLRSELCDSDDGFQRTQTSEADSDSDHTVKPARVAPPRDSGSRVLRVALMDEQPDCTSPA